MASTTACPSRSSFSMSQDSFLWFDQPAGSDWNVALPIGSGRLGAMVFGNVADERIQLNEDTVWSGGGRDRINPQALGALPEIRRLLNLGQPAAAEELTQRCLGGIPDSQLLYQPLADLWLEMAYPGRPRPRPAEETQVRLGLAPAAPPPPVTEYRRELDLAAGEARVSYRLDGVTYQRTHLASYPAGVIAVRLTADRPGALSFSARLTRGTTTHYAARYLDCIRQVDGNALVGTGRAGGELGHVHAVALRCHHQGGTLRLDGETLVVSGADSVILVIAGATSFRHTDPVLAVRSQTASALATGWETLQAEHRRDHGALFARVRLDLGPAVDLPIPQRVARLKSGAADPDLLRLFFDFGRYLLIASSRPGSLPANLQGRWCQDMEPAWGGKYTININTQMNYWPAESCALGECHEALFDLIDRLRLTGAEVARRMYGCRGFVVHHNTDLVADACPTDRNLAATYWPMGGAWLSLHLWERWNFTADPRDLQRAWPVLREAALFFLDFLSPDHLGRLVVSPSCSPENIYRLPNGQVSAVCAGASMDTQIVDLLFRATEACATAIGTASDFAAQLAAARQRLPLPAIGRHGQLQEWAEDYDEIEPGHRHVSHLFALHPGGTIDPVSTPELAHAARVSLDRRLAAGGAGTGWSRAWTVNFLARLGDGERAHQHLQHLVAHCTLPNLFDDHPPFQIDGNFGACAGIAELLVHSHRRTPEGHPELDLLPALPRAWPTGAVQGLRVRGGGTLETLEWHDGALHRAVLTAAAGSPWTIRTGQQLTTVTMPASGRLEILP
jgi:alpha-L-fucosidase 2